MVVLGVLFGLAIVQPDTRTEHPAGAALAAVCEISQDLWVVHRGVFDSTFWAQSATQRAALLWRRLPAAIDCDGSERRLSREGASLTHFAVSDDGSLIGVEGRFVRGALDGQGNRCFFERTAGHWRPVSCEGLWVS